MVCWKMALSSLDGEPPVCLHGYVMGEFILASLSTSFETLVHIINMEGKHRVIQSSLVCVSLNQNGYKGCL